MRHSSFQFCTIEWTHIFFNLEFFFSVFHLAGWRLFIASFARSKYQRECIFGDFTWAMQSPKFIDPISTVAHGNGTRNGTVLQFGTWKWKRNDDIVANRNDVLAQTTNHPSFEFSTNYNDRKGKIFAFFSNWNSTMFLNRVKENWCA